MSIKEEVEELEWKVWRFRTRMEIKRTRDRWFDDLVSYISYGVGCAISGIVFGLLTA